MSYQCADMAAWLGTIPLRRCGADRTPATGDSWPARCYNITTPHHHNRAPQHHTTACHTTTPHNSMPHHNTTQQHTSPQHHTTACLTTTPHNSMPHHNTVIAHTPPRIDGICDTILRSSHIQGNIFGPKIKTGLQFILLLIALLVSRFLETHAF